MKRIEVRNKLKIPMLYWLGDITETRVQNMISATFFRLYYALKWKIPIKKYIKEPYYKKGDTDGRKEV